MISIYTPDRAERLTRSFEAQSQWRVQRMLEEQPIISQRVWGDLIISTRLYARIWKGSALRLNVTYEVIDARSVIW